MVRRLSFALTLALLLPTGAFFPTTHSVPRHIRDTAAPPSSDPPPVKLTQVPSTVGSYQPVLIFAQVSSQASQLQVSPKLQISCGSNDTSLITCARLSVTLTPPSYSLIPYPGAQGWYFAAIPGLPAVTTTVAKPCARVPPTCRVGITLSSNVTYSILVNGISSGTGSYAVQQSSVTQNIPPVVGAFVTQDMFNSTAMAETYGLSPGGWVAGPTDSIPITAFAFGLNGIQSLGEYYSQSGGSAVTMTGAQDPIQATLDNAVSSLDNTISGVNSLTGSSFAYLVNPIAVQDATIPQVGLGNYVTFYAASTDKNGNSGTSPQGFYYIVNTQASTKVLIIDPHVKLWLLLQNLQTYANLVKYGSGYQLPPDFRGNDSLLLEAAQLLHNFESAQFHYWNLLGESYNLIISFPDSNVEGLLQTFQPRAIYLSDLSLGYESQQGTPSQFFDWDLNDIKDTSGQTILSDVISYTQQHDSGLIGSAGVLSDWEVGCPGSQTKVGSRGNVGDQLSDANPVSEQTLAPMFGMPLLPVFEYARDQAAEGSGSVACPAVGSIPLLVPGLPWNGSLDGPSAFPVITENRNPSIMANLPPELSIVMPSYQPLGYDAANTVGWQLSLPDILASAAWSAINTTRSSPQVQQSEMSLSGLSSNITGASVGPGGLDCALEQGLSGFYRPFTDSGINETGIDFSVSVPCSGLALSRFVPLPSQLASLWPVQIAALSPDFAAGIVTYDKYFMSNGYRSVYFSFPAEASSQPEAEAMMSNAINWAIAWQYHSVTKLGGLVVASAATFQTLQSAINGQVIDGTPVLANEQGNSTVSFAAPSAGTYRVVVASPSSGIGTLKLSSNAQSSAPQSLGDNVTAFEVGVSSPGQVTLYLTSDAASVISPMYVEIVQASSTSTTTMVSTTSTTPPAATSTVTSSASTTSSSSATISTSSSGGRIPEFPFQLVAVTVFTVLVVTSYLLARRRR